MQPQRNDEVARLDVTRDRSAGTVTFGAGIPSIRT